MKTLHWIALAFATIPLMLRGEEIAQNAKLVAVTGDVSITSPSGAGSATVGADLPVGTVLTTAHGGQATVKFFDGTVAVVQADSNVSIQTHSVTSEGGTVSKENTLLDLKSGGVIASLDPAKKNITNFRVRTPKGVAAARGTVFSVRVEQDNANSTVTTMAGVVTFVTDQGEFSVSFGNVGSASGVLSVVDAVKANPNLANEILEAAYVMAASVGNGTVTNTSQTPNLVTTVLAAVTEVAVEAAPNRAAETVKKVIGNAGSAGASSVSAIADAAKAGAQIADPANSAQIDAQIDEVINALPHGGNNTPILPPLDQTQVLASPSDAKK